MNREIFIKENFKVDDSHSKVRGFVFAYDENDNLVFAKENMIVETGRKYIMQNKIESSSFKSAFLCNNADMVEAGDTIDNIGSIIETNMNNVLSLEGVTSIENYVPSSLTEDDYFSCKVDYEALEIQCLIVFNSDVNIQANSLGLIVKDASNNDILFSRVTFPTYYKSATQKLTFKYYIYF